MENTVVVHYGNVVKTVKSTNFWMGVASGILISLITFLLPHLTVQVSPEIDYKLLPIEMYPHYEFQTGSLKYRFYADVTYHIKPPLLPLFNKVDVLNPEGFGIYRRTEENGCAILSGTGKAHHTLVQTKVTGWHFPECTITATFSKDLEKHDIALEYPSESWRREIVNGKLLEEQGIRIESQIDAPVQDYIFFFTQTNTSSIKTPLPMCEEINVFIDGYITTEFRINIFEGNRTIAIKFDLAPQEVKDLRIQCLSKI